ncbi:hypothetical protein ACH4SP_08470 [Streptomyces sp. NPDC021093]|uniref:hypothetical protein n=1 Tax=Streptomyces sp. NPDC021093 TaxID=3365112 RepID=UPI003792DAB7
MPTFTTRTAPRGAALVSPASLTSLASLVSVPLLLLGAGASASADDKNPPAMSIALTDGVDTVSSGSRLAYTVTVQNQGPTNLAGLRIEQALPSGASAAAAGQRAKVAGGKAVWTADVRGHGKTVLTSTATLGSAQTGALRAASTVCAYLPKSHVPVVCSSDMNLLPTGPRTEGVELADGSGESAALLGMDPAVAIGATAGAALFVGGGVLVLRRRRKSVATVG